MVDFLSVYSLEFEKITYVSDDGVTYSAEAYDDDGFYCGIAYVHIPATLPRIMDVPSLEPPNWNFDEGVEHFEEIDKMIQEGDVRAATFDEHVNYIDYSDPLKANIVDIEYVISMDGKRMKINYRELINLIFTLSDCMKMIKKQFKREYNMRLSLKK